MARGTRHGGGGGGGIRAQIMGHHIHTSTTKEGKRYALLCLGKRHTPPLALCSLSLVYVYSCGSTPACLCLSDMLCAAPPQGAGEVPSTTPSSFCCCCTSNPSPASFVVVFVLFLPSSSSSFVYLQNPGAPHAILPHSPFLPRNSHLKTTHPREAVARSPQKRPQLAYATGSPPTHPLKGARWPQCRPKARCPGPPP